MRSMTRKSRAQQDTTPGRVNSKYFPIVFHGPTEQRNLVAYGCDEASKCLPFKNNFHHPVWYSSS